MIKVFLLQHRYWLVSVFIASLLFRTIVFYGYLQYENRYWQVDSTTYVLVAEKIAEGKGCVKADMSPQMHRLPGYSYFLAMLYRCFGQRLPDVLLVQIIIASCIPLLIFFLSLVIVPGNIFLAQCVSAFSVMHIGLVLYAGFLMTESLFIFFFFIFLYFFFLLLRRLALHESWYIQAFSAGIFLGIASLIRPVGHYCVIVGMVLICFLVKNISVFNRMIVAGWFFFSWLSIVLWWLLRNWFLTQYIFFHTLPGGHFLYLSAARVAMHEYACSYQEARKIIRATVDKQVQEQELIKGFSLNEIEYCVLQEKLAISYFKKRPLCALRYWIMDIVRCSCSLYSAELLYLESGRKEINYFERGRTLFDGLRRYLIPDTQSIVLKYIIYWELLLYCTILLGALYYLLRNIKKIIIDQDSIIVSLLIFCLLFIGLALAGGYARMRLPIEPLIWIIGFHGLLILKKVLNKKAQD